MADLSVVGFLLPFCIIIVVTVRRLSVRIDGVLCLYAVLPCANRLTAAAQSGSPAACRCRCGSFPFPPAAVRTDAPPAPSPPALHTCPPMQPSGRALARGPLSVGSPTSASLREWTRRKASLSLAPPSTCIGIPFCSPMAPTPTSRHSAHAAPARHRRPHRPRSSRLPISLTPPQPPKTQTSTGLRLRFGRRSPAFSPGSPPDPLTYGVRYPSAPRLQLRYRLGHAGKPR